MESNARPRKIVMLAFEDAQILDITGPLQILGSANRGRRQPITRSFCRVPRREAGLRPQVSSPAVCAAARTIS